MWSFDTGHYVEALFKRGVRTLYFNGNQDAVCNWRGTERWLDELEWTSHQEFNEAGREDWIVDNKPADWKRTSPLLSFAHVRGAGHTASANPSIPEKTSVDLTSGTPPYVVHDG
jgi:carboxypeptidase C (cathepsin A)